MISPSIQPKSLSILYQVASEINALNDKEKKVASVFFDLEENKVFSTPSDERVKFLHVGLLQKEKKLITTNYEYISLTFRNVLSDSCKEINLLEGDARVQASEKFWQCYDFYNDLEIKRTGKADSSVLTPVGDQRTVIKDVLKSVKERNESLFKKIDKGLIPLLGILFAVSEVAILAYGGILTAAGIATGGLVLAIALGLLIATAGLALSVVAGISIVDNFRRAPLLEVEKQLKSLQAGIHTPEQKQILQDVWSKLTQLEKNSLSTVLDKETPNLIPRNPS